MRIRDRKNLDPRPGIWEGKKIGSRIQDSGSGMEKFGSRIRDKHPGSAKVEISSPNLLGLKEPNNNQTLCGKAFCHKIKSFLQSKATSVALKRGKTPINWIFKSPTRHGRHCQTTSSRGETVTAAYLHKALAKN
jgi:hypothetical protein